MLHTLRQLVDNDQKWRMILRKMNKKFYHQTVTTNQIEAFLSRETALDLTPFFNQYLRSIEIPTLEYKVENDVLIFDKLSGLESGEEDASLLSNKQYTSFEITFDWKIEKGGNSGFMWGVREDSLYKYPYQTGPEIQIIDTQAYDVPEEIQGGEIEYNNIVSDLAQKKHYLGALYGLFPPNNQIKPKTAGEWNNYHIKIDQELNKGWVKLNNILINEFPLEGELWDERVSMSKFSKFIGYLYLHIGKPSASRA